MAYYPQRASQAFRVSLGHVEVVVHCESAEAALRLARRQLSHDHPRLWDVIYRVRAEEFRIDPYHRNAG